MEEMAKLLLLFVLVPAVELALLIEIGSRIGTASTLLLIVMTGVVGASLASRQGLEVLRQIQAEVAVGRMPGSAIVDGVIILLAGVVLMTPGVLTDLLGFLCLIPGTRRLIKIRLRRAFERAARQGRARVVVNVETPGPEGPQSASDSPRTTWPPSFP